MHARFVDDTSDFLSFLLLWDYINEQQAALSSSQLRKMCHREYINYLRIREWQDLFAQLREMGRTANIHASSGRDINASAHEIDIHKSLLSGLLSHVGVKEEREKDSRGRNRGPREYLGARGTKFAIFPGSGLFKRAPTGCSPPNSSKPPACGHAPTPPSTRSGSKKSASTSSACNTPNRTGRLAPARQLPMPRAPSSA